MGRSPTRTVLGEPVQQGNMSVLREIRNGHDRVRVMARGQAWLLTHDEVFDLAELLDDMCDEIEDETDDA